MRYQLLSMWVSPTIGRIRRLNNSRVDLVNVSHYCLWVGGVLILVIFFLAAIGLVVKWQVILRPHLVDLSHLSIRLKLICYLLYKVALLVPGCMPASLSADLMISPWSTFDLPH